MTSIDSQQIRIIPFDGTEDNWRQWKFKAKAYLLQKGYYNAVMTETELIKPKERSSSETTTQQQIDYDQNIGAFTFLALSCNGTAVGYVENCETDRAPFGDAHKAWKNLCERYESTDMESEYASIETAFHACELGSDGPDKWFQDLDYWNNRLERLDPKYKRDELQMKTHIVSKLPDELHSIKVKVAGDLGSISKIKLEKIIRDMHALETNKNTTPVFNTQQKHNDQQCKKCGRKNHTTKECKAHIKCYNCGKKGHFANECKKPKRTKEQKEDTTQGMFVGATLTPSKNITHSNQWVLDSGATVHVASRAGMICKECDTKPTKNLMVGDGNQVKVEKIGEANLNIAGTEMKLKNVHQSTEFVKNIVSLPQLLSDGYMILNGNSKTITLKTPTGKIMEAEKHGGLYYLNDQSDAVLTTTDEGFRCTLEEAHKLLGHPDEKTTKANAKELKWKLITNTMPLCGACSLAKAKAKGVPKTAKHKAEKPGDRLFVDISGPYKKSQAEASYWMLIVDDFSGKMWSSFMKKKSEMVFKMREFLKLMRVKDIKPKYIRCDNAGENLKSLQTLSQEFPFDIETTAPHTPQPNGKVERAFATLLNKTVAMMIDAKLTDKMQGKLWNEFAATATKLHNNILKAGETQTAEEKFSGTRDKQLMKNLVIPGTIGYVSKRLKQPKLEPKAFKAMLLGFPDYHSRDTYLMYNPETQATILSRDVKWTNFHGGIKPTEDMEQVLDQNKEEKENWEEDEEVEVQGLGHKASNEQEEKSNDIQASKVNRELERLNTYYNPTPLMKPSEKHSTGPITRSQGLQTEEDTTQDEIENLQVMYIGNASLQSSPNDPKNYKEMLKIEDTDAWLESIEKEYSSINQRNVFGEKLDSLPPNTKALGTRWVFKTKPNGLKKSRLVVKGYDQIPGVDFTESFSPVANNGTVNFVLASSLYMMKEGTNTSIDVIDVETAFLNANLHEDVYIHKPEGYKLKGEDQDFKYIKLNKALYGLVQAPREWFQTISTFLNTINLEDDIYVRQSKVDPCLFLAMNGKVQAFILVYVDDCIIAGETNTVNQLKAAIRDQYAIKDLGPIENYLGVNYKLVTAGEEPHILIDMSTYIKALVKDYEKEFETVLKETKIPASKQQMNKEDELVMGKTTSQYRSYIGRLMFAVIKCIPECAHSLRTLCQHMDEPTSKDWGGLEKLIGYLKWNYKPLKLITPTKCKAHVFVDSDYAADREDRKSITGIVTTLGGSIISWMSKKQGGVTLSSTEAEYVAMSTAACEIKYLNQLLKESRNEDLTGVLYEDNHGAIFLSNNQQLGQRTKHIDVRYKFTNEMVKNKELEIRYIESKENPADIMTKVLDQKTHEYLSSKIHKGEMVTVDEDPAKREDVKYLSPVS